MSDDRVLADDPSMGVAINLAELMAAINTLDADGSDRELIDQITGLERIKSACAAAQARLTYAFTLSQQADGAARKVQPDRTRRSIAAQIALARRDSRFRGQQHVGLAHALVLDMPHTMASLSRGELTEYRARTVIEQLACLTPADRTAADTIIAAELPDLGDRSAQSRAAAIAYRIDPEAVMSKIRGAVKDRHVGLRPAPDTMSRLSALLPVAHGVAIYAALSKHADRTVATGDGRARGQIMADELVSRVTGHVITGCDSYGAPTYAAHPESEALDGAETVDRATGPARTGTTPAEAATDKPDPASADGRKTDGATTPAPTATTRPRGSEGAHARTAGGLHINLIMTDRTLFGCDDEPAHLIGHGPIPAQLARSLIGGHADQHTTTWVRRLYTDPTGTRLAAMDSHQRLFPANAAAFLIARDQTCRTPWCDAPIRHLDHVTPHSRGGPTHTDNGQGLCQACNLSKQTSHWASQTGQDGVITTTTPTGHTYPSKPPRPPTSDPWPQVSALEQRLAAKALSAA